jgi:hypothetical protein
LRVVGLRHAFNVVAFPLVRFAEHCLCPLCVFRFQGARFAEFLETVCPCTVKYSKKLVSQDDHSNTFNYKYTSVIEIVPVRPFPLSRYLLVRRVCEA